MQCSGAKSPTDDLCLSHGVVLGGAATSLRSFETKPFDWQICLLQTDISAAFKGSSSVLVSCLLQHRASLAISQICLLQTDISVVALPVHWPPCSPGEVELDGQASNTSNCLNYRLW